MSSIQITDPSTFKLTNLIVESDPKSISSSTGEMYSPKITVRYPDGKVGPLLFDLGARKSFGLSDGLDQYKKAGQRTKYSLPIHMHSLEGPTPEELKLIEVFDSIAHHLRAYVFENKGKFKLGGCQSADTLMKNGPTFITYKEDKENGGRKWGERPVLYASVPYSDRGGKMKWFATFKDEYDRTLDPLKFLNESCTAEVIVQIKSFETYPNLKNMRVSVNVYNARLTSSVYEQPNLLKPTGKKPPTNEEEALAEHTTMFEMEEDEAVRDKPLSQLLPEKSAPLDPDSDIGEGDSEAGDDEESEEEAAPVPVIKPAARIIKAKPSSRTARK